MAENQVSAVTVNQDMKERLSQMMKSLDYIVFVVILAAAALAFIVLYNLTNINITERIREIATVKVLGFFPKRNIVVRFSGKLGTDSAWNRSWTGTWDFPASFCYRPDTCRYGIL